MSARYTLAEFNHAGLSPDDQCDYGPYGDPGEDAYWFACDYHEGYIDGHAEASAATGELTSLHDHGHYQHPHAFADVSHHHMLRAVCHRDECEGYPTHNIHWDGRTKPDFEVRPFVGIPFSDLDALFARPPGYEWRDDLERLVAVRGEQIVGHVAWGKHRPKVVEALEVDADGPLVEIQQLRVADLHRRAGIARQLVRDAVMDMLAAGYQPVLACSVDNGAALALYLGEGFEVSGRFIVAGKGAFYSMLLHNEKRPKAG